MSAQRRSTGARPCAGTLSSASALAALAALALATLLALGGCAAPRKSSGTAPDAAKADAPPASPEPPRDAAPAPPAPLRALEPAPVAPAPFATEHDSVARKPGTLRDGSDVFAVLRDQLQTQACSDDRVVRRWLSNYARSPARFAANLQRVLPLLAHVVDRVRAHDLPGEFALLPIVESWYRPDARNGGTAGLWQFSTATARGNGLRVDDIVDQRYAPGPATDAALAHLSDLQRRFGDWRLAVMAFNAGEYRLARLLPADAPAPSPEDHQPPGLALTTYEHLAKLLALACLVREPERIGLQLPSAPFQPLATATLLADAGAPAAPAAPARVHVVRSGDSLWTIARRHGTTVKKLLRWNALSADAVLRPGQRVRLHP